MSYSEETVARATAVALRQAFGAKFEETPQDEELVSKIKAGVVVLAPHEDYKVEGEITWDEDPYGQRNWIAQLHMLRWIDPLRRAASQGDGEAQDLWEKHARSWIAANPPERPAIRWAWSDMVEAMRAHALLLGLPYVKDPQWILESLEVHGDWLEDDAHIGHGNHELHQHVSLILIGSALGRQDWTDLASSRLNNYFTSAYDEEGVNEEGAIGYWDLNYRWSRAVVKRMKLEGIDASIIEGAIALTPLSLAHATRPDGKYEQIGDTAPGGPVRLESPYTEYVASAGAKGSPPPERLKVYSAGYVFGRSGWGETVRRTSEETFYSLRFGPGNSIHGHPDGAGVTFFSQGMPVLVDSGKDAYTQSAMRKYVLNRLGHNVPHVRGKKYDLTKTVELVRHEVLEDHEFFVFRDEGYANVVIERSVLYSHVTESLLVADMFSSDESIDGEVRWHVSPDLTALQDGRGKVVLRKGKAGFSILWGGTAPEIGIVSGSEEPFEGWISTGWNKKVATPLVIARRSGKRFRMVTAIVPEAVEAGRLETVDVGLGSPAFMLHGQKRREWIWFSGKEVKSGLMSEEEVIASRDHKASLPALRTPAVGHEPLNPRVPAVDVPRYERENQEAREALWNVSDRSLAQDWYTRLGERLLSGWDYGAAATLRDFATTSPELADRRFDGVLDSSRSRVGIPVLSPAGNVKFGPSLLPTQSYQTMPEVLRGGDVDTAHVFEAGPLAIIARLKPGTGRTLIVGFSGAIDRKSTIQPRFERTRSLSKIGAPTLVIPDPTLDLNGAVNLAWYIGSASHDASSTIAGIVRAAMQTTGCDRIVFVGSSGGGFASMQVAAHIPGSRALVLNPQTDVRRYHERWGRVGIEAAFGFGAEEIPAERVSVLSRFALLKPDLDIDYVSNIQDGHHIQEHANPFLSEVASVAPAVRVNSIREDWGPGHVGASEEAFLQLLKQSIDLGET